MDAFGTSLKHCTLKFNARVVPYLISDTDSCIASILAPIFISWSHQASIQPPVLPLCCTYVWQGPERERKLYVVFIQNDAWEI